MNKLSVHQRKARDFIQREDWANALGELERMLDADGGNPTLHNQIGDVYLRKEDVPSACEHFERAIDLYAEQGLHNNAVALCKKVTRLRPSRVEVRWRLARLRLDQGFRAEAAAHFHDWLEQAPTDGDAADTLESRCREIVDLLPDDAPVGKILEKLEGTQRFGAALDLVRKLAQCAADAGDDAAARRYGEKMRSLRVLVERSGGRDLLGDLQAARLPESPSEFVAAAVLAPPVPPVEVVAPHPPLFLEPASIDLPPPEPVAIDLGLESDPPMPAAGFVPPARDWEADTGAGVLPAADDTTHGVPEYELPETSFADLAQELGEALVLPDSLPPVAPPAAFTASQSSPEPPPPPPSPSQSAAPAWMEAADGWTETSRDGLGASLEPVYEPKSATTGPGGWVEQLRKSPVWIPAGDDLAGPEAGRPDQGSTLELESVIDSFREQMARALDGDGAARYDLGVAYYEMGLYNEALAEFEAASRCPGFEVRSYEMLAMCLLQSGRHGEVVELLLPLLAADGHEPHGTLGLQYCLGLAYEASGEGQRARRCFQEVALVDGGFKDVRERLQQT